MINTLDKIEQDFIESLDNIVAFIDLIDLIKSKNFDYMKKSKFYKDTDSSFNTIKDFLNNTKIVQYNAIIISLYGAYELSIKKATNTFIKFSVNNEFPLTHKLTKNYLLSVSKTFEKNNAQKNKDIIKDLNSFLNENDVSKFQSELSLNNYQNLKIATVQEISKLIEINNLVNNIKHTLDFEKYIKERENLSSIEQAVKYIDILNNPFNLIDDIVDSRNRIAHRGFEENMLDNDMLKGVVIKEFKVFVLNYIYLLKNAWYEECLKQGKNIEELEILKIFNNNIICFNTKNISVSKKNVILVKDGKNRCKFGQILSIQHDNEEIEISLNNQNIGCKLDVTCKDNFKYYIYCPS